jgi:hypothetical protein
MVQGDVLETVGKVLVLFASIALVTLLAFAFLAVFSYVEPYYSVPQVVDGLLPATLMSIVALVAGTVALVASKILESTKMNPPPH